MMTPLPLNDDLLLLLPPLLLLLLMMMMMMVMVVMMVRMVMMTQRSRDGSMPRRDLCCGLTAMRSSSQRHQEKALSI
jgi:hypothetical protein